MNNKEVIEVLEGFLAHFDGRNVSFYQEATKITLDTLRKVESGELTKPIFTDAEIKKIESVLLKLESGKLVEVVRCKDCYKKNTSWCKQKHEVADMDFCNGGERKEKL